MFCPNCGNDCADMKFCPMCGTKIPQVEAVKKEQEDSYEIPYREMYISDARAHMHIARSFVSITKQGFFKKVETQIPYEKLRRVRYCRNELLRDSISFYWDDMAVTDSGKENVITLDFGGSEGFFEYPSFPEKFQIFYMFKVLAPHAELETSFAEQHSLILERFSYIDNLDDYYHRFSPLRNQAVFAIMKEHGLPKKDAKDLIDTLFIKHLKELYQSEPLLALRDYHLIRAEIHRINEEDKQKSIERAILRN